jgi:lipid-binding SYLF domain-containing protein
MKNLCTAVVWTLLMFAWGFALADDYSDTIDVFKKAGASAWYFDHSYGYAVFPSIGKGGLIVGGAHGTGRVYQGGQYVGDTTMTQVSVGLQVGGEAYRQIIFFEDKRSFDEFTTGNFEFDAGASAVAIKAAASSSAGTTGTSTETSGQNGDANAQSGGFYKGLAVFTIIKGGAMAAAAVAGQKFTYAPHTGSSQGQ